MKILLIVSLVLTVALANICDQPQRRFYMSFPTLSKRDLISKLFQEMNKDIPTYQNSYTDSQLQANFKITNVRPQVYYNDHYQKDVYIDKYRANVTMGVLTASTYFNFSVIYSGKNKTGNIRALGAFDASYFTKNLTLTEGYLEWKPDIVPGLTFSNMFHIEFYTPELTEDEIFTFTKMLNGQAGQTRIKQDFNNHVNAHYVPLLIDYLNHQRLISSNNITYVYKNITLEFLNYAKSFELSNDNTKGLEVSLLFGLESSNESCPKLSPDFDEDNYGGLQQIYTLSIMRGMFKQALSKGLYDVTLDRTWQVPGFQFYMGDLGNFVPYANFLPSSDPFTAKCKFNSSRLEKSFKFSIYTARTIYTSVPVTCIVNYQAKDVLAVDLDVILELGLYGEEESIRVVVQQTVSYGETYTSLDSKFQVTSPLLAKYSIGQVLKGLMNKPVFGTDFPLIKRRYPVVELVNETLIAYDPSEP